MRVTLDGTRILGGGWGVQEIRADGWVLVPPTLKFGKSNGRTRDQLR